MKKLKLSDTSAAAVRKLIDDCAAFQKRASDFVRSCTEYESVEIKDWQRDVQMCCGELKSMIVVQD